jgi:hypothetical protein
VSDPPNRDDETPALRGILPVRERVRAATCEPDDVRSNRGKHARDTDEFEAPDEWGETTAVRQARELERRFGAIEERLTAIHGQRGDNGKLKGHSDKIRFLYWVLGVVFVAAVGAVGTALHAASNAGERTGRDEHRLLRAEQDIATIYRLIWPTNPSPQPQPKGIDP